MQQPKIYYISDHDINPSLIDQDALYIIHKLKEAGFVAYLVGGSVRDLLLKTVPKDFDISTSAAPEQIKKLFGRSCLLIGRRFRLAHIRFGHKVIEVSTFRSGDNESDLIVQDNSWGTPEEDVLRRDFTVNGLFYDPSDHSVIDYVGGWEDIQKKVLRTIGLPELRFHQDPIRMIRLLKFRARFGFSISIEARQALLDCRHEILKSSPARLLEEVLRMLESGAAAPFFNLMAESGISELIFPTLTPFIKGMISKEILTYLTAADKVNQSLGKKPLDRAVLVACLIHPLLQQEIKKNYQDMNVVPHLGDIIVSVSSVVKHFERDSFVKFPRRLTAIVTSLLTMQYRLTPVSGKVHHQKAFRGKDVALSLMFLKLRALVDKSLIDIYSSWKKLYRHHEHQKDRARHHAHAPHHPKHSDHVGERHHVHS